MAPPSVNGNGNVAKTNGHATEGTSVDDGHIQQLWSRYEAMKHNDQVKNLLLEVSNTQHPTAETVLCCVLANRATSILYPFTDMAA